MQTAIGIERQFIGKIDKGAADQARRDATDKIAKLAGDFDEAIVCLRLPEKADRIGAMQAAGEICGNFNRAAARARHPCRAPRVAGRSPGLRP